MPKPRSLLLHLLLIASCIANAAGADDAPSQEPTTPSSSFQGEWQLLHASIGVSAMHMQLLPGNFVLMFDRTDTGPSNISLAALAPCAATVDGADCTAHSVLLDLRSNVLHPYPLATNPWCSSGALLPSGDRVARLFSPATGWVELPSFLAARRWYATDMILPDGRVLILGWRRQSNLEYFPPADDVAPAPALTFFPFMDETTEPDAENNLCPFGRSSTSSLTALSLSLPVTVPSTSTHITRPMRRAEELPVIWLIRLCPDAHMSFLVWPYDFLEQMDENIKSVTF